MLDQQTADVVSVVDEFENAGAAPGGDEFARIASVISKMFGVDQDEVAILHLSAKHKNLKFIIPEKLAAVGSIPLTSATALAARTARERRAEIVNNFSSARHASVFEGVPLGREPGDLIQKIMSAPIMDGHDVSGVVQISRKGRSPSDSGPDFTQKDLRALVSLSPSMSRFLKLCVCV
jgi:hypothetical protein